MLHSADSVRSPRGRHTDTDKDRESNGNPSPISASRMLNSTDYVRSPRRHVDTDKEREQERKIETRTENGNGKEIEIEKIEIRRGMRDGQEQRTEEDLLARRRRIHIATQKNGTG